MLNLPKELEREPAAEQIVKRLSEALRVVPEADDVSLPTLAATPSLEEALRVAQRDGTLAQGLEAATRWLANEQRGLEALYQRTGRPAKVRLNRILLVGPGASARFYRDVAALVRRHGGRLIALRIEPGFEGVVAAALGANRSALALLVHGKDPVGAILRGLPTGG